MKKLFLTSFLAVILFFISFRYLKQYTGPCANSISCVNDLSGSYQEGRESVYMGKKVSPPVYIAESFQPAVLGETTEDKHIFVDLSKQRLTAVEGGRKILEFPVSTGKWFPTPTGEFRIWVKLRYAHMSGGNPAAGTYYNLYNVPYTMFFANNYVGRGSGFSLHGAYWHDNFGYPMSHGCVNIRPEDAAKLYNWAGPSTQGDTTPVTNDNPGTAVTIFGEPPV